MNIKLKKIVVGYSKVMTGCWDSTVQGQIHWQAWKGINIYTHTPQFATISHISAIHPCCIIWYKLFPQI